MLGVTKRDMAGYYIWNEEITQTFPECARLVERVLVLHQRRYRRLASLHVMWFRIIGGLEIVLSVSLPVFFALLDMSEPVNQVVLLCISVAIALTAALRNFYGWQENWQLHRASEVRLTDLVAGWELVLTGLKLAQTPDMQDKALEQTRRTIQDVMSVLNNEQQATANTTPVLDMAGRRAEPPLQP